MRFIWKKLNEILDWIGYVQLTLNMISQLNDYSHYNLYLNINIYEFLPRGTRSGSTPFFM